MAALATFLLGIFQVIAGVFARFVIAEKAARLAAVVTFIAMTTVLIGLLYGLIFGFYSTALSLLASAHPSIPMGLGLAINSSTIAAAGAFMTIWIACQVYKVKKTALEWATK